MRRIDSSALKPADVLMCMGSNRVVSWLLRNIDRGCYSHGTVFVGPGVLGPEIARQVVAEARPREGFWAISLERLQGYSLYIDAYRPTRAGKELPEPAVTRVVDAAAGLVARGGFYDIPYAAVLVTLGWLTERGSAGRDRAHHLLHLLNRVVDRRDRGMVCTEFVYRCFLEAGIPLEVDRARATVRPESVLPSDLEGSRSLGFLGRLYGPDDAPWPAAAGGGLSP